MHRQYDRPGPGLGDRRDRRDDRSKAATSSQDNQDRRRAIVDRESDGAVEIRILDGVQQRRAVHVGGFRTKRQSGCGIQISNPRIAVERDHHVARCRQSALELVAFCRARLQLSLYVLDLSRLARRLLPHRGDRARYPTEAER